MTLHTAYAVRYGASTVLSGMTNLDTQTNPTVENESAAGTPFPQFAVITSQKPKIMFASKQVAAVLALTGLTGVAIDASNNLFAVYAKLGSNGLPASGSVHRQYTANRGLLLPRRLTCGLRASATVDVEALLYSADGAAHPLTISDTVALPVLTQNNIQHAIGPVSIGVSGSVATVGCVQNISIDFGSGAETVGCGSDLYDGHLHYPRSAPVITISGIDASAFGGTNAVPAVGKAIDHANTKIFLRKRATSGIGFVADATEEHIQITANGVAVVTQHTGQGTSRAEVTIQITTSWDATNAPITIDTTAAIA
jgi:hypothetical protein